MSADTTRSRAATFSTASFDAVTFYPATDKTPAILAITEPNGGDGEPNIASGAFNLSELHEFVLWMQEQAESEPHATPARVEIHALLTKLYGRHAFHWADDEPNAATGYHLLAEACDFANEAVRALKEAGYL